MKNNARQWTAWAICALSAVGLWLLLAPMAEAHVKWFVDESVIVPGFEPFRLTEPKVLVWIVIALAVVSLSAVLDTMLPNVRVVDSKSRHDAMEILRIFTGMSLLLTAYEGALLAPHLVAYAAFGTTMVFLQAIIGILLIANRFVRHAAILMLILHLGVTIQFGVISALEYLVMPGIAVFLLINNLPTLQLRERFKPYSVDCLRILTGISLITLGMTEKLTGIGSVMAQSFVATYQWNFMNILGVQFFDDRLFVLSAGMVEVIFGVILVLGTTTRLNVLALSVVLFASNVLFILEGNTDAALVEFVGHMPVIGVALILILLGYGQRLKITNLLPERRVNTTTKTIQVPRDA